MKLHNIITRIFFCCMLAPLLLVAQDVRTVKTRVADILVLLPAKDNTEAARLFNELKGLGSEGLGLVTEGVRPNGNAEGIASRYAVSLLTHYATAKEDKARIETAYLAALSKAQEPEVKAYLVDNLKLIGSDNAVSVLASLIQDPALADPAIGALVSNGSPRARQALLDALNNATGGAQVRLVRAVGELKHAPAIPALTKFAAGSDVPLKKQALWSLALVADAASFEVLAQQAKQAGFKAEPAEATLALIEYMQQAASKGDDATARKVSEIILAGTPDAAQQHFRLAALRTMAQAKPAEAVKTLVKEASRFDAEYRKEVLNIAAAGAATPAGAKVWEKEYKKSTGDMQAALLRLLAGEKPADNFITTTLVPALSSANAAVRIAAAEKIANTGNPAFAEPVIAYLLRCADDAEARAAAEALLQLVDKDNVALVARQVDAAPEKGKVALLQVLAARRASPHFEVVLKQTRSDIPNVRRTAFEALPYVSAARHTGALLSLLAASGDDQETKVIQEALIAVAGERNAALVRQAYDKDKLKLLPLLPYFNDRDALGQVTSAFNEGSEKEKAAAFGALVNWQTDEATRTLLGIVKDPAQQTYHEPAFYAFVNQVSKSSMTDDQKLLMLRDIMPLATDDKEKTAVLKAAGSARTFLSFMFVSAYIDDKDLGSTASRAAMQVALPASDARPGLTGAEVRKTLQRILDKIKGEDSQYEKIDIETYLQKLPFTRGYEPIFNGKDLSGWQGLVENPIARGKMTAAALAKKQAEANGKLKDSWSVRDGAIWFSGEGGNLCTTRPYGDFEMIVDWKISRNGDSGIYLRGSPQVQIWDPSRTQDGAQVGSGGLYNNQKNKSTPLVPADNPVGEWNTFYIKMVGDRVTVYLNGILVVDNVAMENYWDRSLPIFTEEAIELQAHGTELAFRNIYVNELSHRPYTLTSEEKQEGYAVLFNGKDLDNWVGNKTDYVVEDNTIAIYPTKRGHGNLFTEKEYDNFTLRFEFQLTPGANNGLGIHAPLEGDAAYLGKEIQILDNTAPVYSKLEVYQYHGSVYGIIPAKREFLKPVGEWNYEEVYVNGDYIKVTLNGTIITEGDLKKATKNGTLDHKDHPGLNKYKGYIGFLGHGSVVKFRNIRIKELK